jgi:hypothetical protein
LNGFLAQLNILILTCKFGDGFKATMLVLPEATVPIASRFAEEIERMAAASAVATVPAVTNEYSAMDIAGVESVQT